MYIVGEVKQVFPLQSGESSRGVWRKKEFVIETFAKIPKNVCVSIRGEAAETQSINVGDKIKASLDLESREYKGRWYTEVKAWKIEPASEDSGDSPQSEDMSPPPEIDRTEDTF